ncbi:hypothetical protein Dacet_2241 [Denitrovibrio acetiphilus DSM 12809]|uniref:Uncharacterized protein n=1 Tax=Denitrovibrio acetiphilus (strain DSM 12809 / NBRC 114555 / N2460) TaxID=522772 RepID=D4H2Y0_DENA2|nr:hypothetical protein [Denitrovibrio acetiphilus]ADD69003.1 hypothetical protein Dacet_2241 [Denitrovibrio acetiphilus DSM 12809]
MAKVTISFVTDTDDSKTTIESDPDRNKDYTGSTKTRFRYGDTAYFRIYSHEPDKLAVSTTDGELADLGIYAGSVADEILTFITDQTAETEKPVRSVTAYEWLGNSLGKITMQDSYTLFAEKAPSADNIAAVNISYTTSYRLYSITLSKRAFDEYPVMVYVRSEDV